MATTNLNVRYISISNKFIILDNIASAYFKNSEKQSTFYGPITVKHL